MKKDMIMNKIKYMSQIILEIFGAFKNISYIISVINKHNKSYAKHEICNH